MTSRHAWRTALVGCGRIGLWYMDDPAMARHMRYAAHAQVLAEHPAFSWQGAVDPEPGAVQECRRRFGVAHVGASLAELAPWSPEVLVLATPPGQRATPLAQAGGELRAVLAEKPLATSLDEAERFMAECDRRGVAVQVNLWRRGDRTHRDLAEGGLERRIGKAQTVSVVYGNGLLNNGTHMVDCLRLFFGEIATVQALDEPSGTALPIPGDYNVTAAIRMESGLTCLMQPLDFTRYRELGMTVWGERGRLTIAHEGLTFTVDGVATCRSMDGAMEIGGDPSTLAPHFGTSFYELYDNLAQALDGTAVLASPGESALITMRAVEAIRRSVRSGGGTVRP